jgi:CBS domain-containing protein
MNVKDLMVTEVACASKDDTLEQAARLMWEEDKGCLVVIDGNGLVVGMITDRDVAMAAYTQGKCLADIRVEAAMSKEVRTSGPDASLAELEAVMRAAQIRRVPVVDRQQRLLGIVSLSDLAQQRSPAAQTVGRTLAAVTAPRQSNGSAHAGPAE